MHRCRAAALPFSVCLILTKTQDANILPDTNLNLNIDKAELLERYFSVWDDEFGDINNAMWAFNTYTYQKQKYYGESQILRTQNWFDMQKQNANFAQFKSILKPAIILRDTAVRSFPTNERLFLSLQPGEGYPFDYLQDSNLEAYHPVLVSHFSLDGAWVFIKSKDNAYCCRPSYRYSIF